MSKIKRKPRAKPTRKPKRVKRVSISEHAYRKIPAMFHTEYKPSHEEKPAFDWYKEPPKVDLTPPISYYNTNEEIRLMIQFYARRIEEMDFHGAISDTEYAHDVKRFCGRMVELVKQLKPEISSHGN